MYFTFFLVLGQMFTVSMWATIPMTEKKGGLRQMMFMNGLRSHEYYIGLFMGDILLYLGPAIIISLALIPVDEIMRNEQIPEFFLCYMLFGATVINLSYMLSNFFDNPETGTTYLALIFTLGLFIGPIAISQICAAIFGYDNSLGASLSPWYIIDPVLTFIVQLYTICNTGKTDDESLGQIKVFGMDDAPSTGLYCGVIIFQILLIGGLNLCLDNYFRSTYKRTGGTDGAAPPMLDVRQDVIDHEREVRENADRLQDDDRSYQIKGIDICKTYPKAERMAVCKNTFGAHKGEVFGLLGPNGAGKSTTFNMIAMQLPITSGNAELMGHDI